jgi:hypothetical protein
MLTDIPGVTRRQKEIVELVYKHRFINRIQIQTLLKHKDYKTINLWLKDLREKHYVEWIYSTDFTEKTKPAIYYLGLNGIRQLKTRNDESLDYLPFPEQELRKRYHESTRSQTYIDRCLLLVDTCIALEQARDEESYPQSWYFYETEADYQGDSFYNFLSEDELIHPHLCFSKEVWEGYGDYYTGESYLLEVFDETLPRYRMSKRIKDYITYLDEEDEEWKSETYTDKLPIILIVCSRLSDLIYTKRKTRGLIADIWDQDDEDRPRIRFTTVDKLKESGIMTEEIWEEA